jgi:hypothetical protein
MLAIFATFSEASAATTLPYLDEESRKFFIAFIIIFPCVLSATWLLIMHYDGKTPTPPISGEQVASPMPTSRVLHAGFLSPPFDITFLNVPASVDPGDVHQQYQFEVLLIKRT